MGGIPRARPGQLKLQWGKLADHNPDFIGCHGEGVPKADVNMLFCFISQKIRRLDLDDPNNQLGFYDPSFIEELEARGYDTRTLKISVEKKLSAAT